MFRQFSINLFSCTILFSIPVLLINCTNADKKNGFSTDPDNLYFDYQITAAEGNDNLTVLLQYRAGGEDGDGVSMADPGKIMLDGEMLLADSSKMTGTFYELHKPIAEFAGKHSIVFTDSNKKEYKEDFSFQPIFLLTRVADTAHRNDLVFEFEGLEAKDFIRVLMTDTSFANNGINRVDAVSNGRLVITYDDLDALANGPVQLEFIREYEKPVKNGTDEGGRLLITYSLKREFFLKD
ncbi:MAG: hypothetical protein LH619_02095 [Chitinophagaceae bacterium]|nr:hypothetical protein [Chitinophagaceae bacterium]